MATYPNQVAFALLSFPVSVPHVGVCFGIKDLTSRGGLGARKVSLKRNWMDEGAVSASYFTRFREQSRTDSNMENVWCL
jgi:hypothetical protein